MAASCSGLALASLMPCPSLIACSVCSCHTQAYTTHKPHSHPAAACPHKQVGFIAGGISNALYKVAPDPETGVPPVAFRIYGDNTENFIDRGVELERMLQLHEAGFGPEVRMGWQNVLAWGFCGLQHTLFDCPFHTVSLLGLCNCLWACPLQATQPQPRLLTPLFRVLFLCTASGHLGTTCMAHSCRNGIYRILINSGVLPARALVCSCWASLRRGALRSSCHSGAYSRRRWLTPALCLP